MANLLQIEKYLKQKRLPYKIIDLGREVFTVKGVVETGISEDEIVKTLIIRTPQFLTSRLRVLSEHGSRSDKTGQANDGFKALAVRGKDRVDFKKVRKIFGSKSELAKPKEVEKVSKVPVGAVCPILLGIPLIFDRKVMDLKHVNMGSGDLTKGLEMDLKDLLEAIDKYQVGDLV